MYITVADTMEPHCTNNVTLPDKDIGTFRKYLIFLLTPMINLQAVRKTISKW